MPYIQVRLTKSINENKMDELQKKLTDAIAICFSKPKSYIMAEIEQNCSLYMGGSKLEAGAMVCVKSLGIIRSEASANLTKQICAILKEVMAIDTTYVTYHPVELWGYNGSNF